jgi:peptidoglycan/LPS O-acetylase OafA/YrhL
MLTLQDRMQSGADNLKLLRLLAATAVIYGHSYAIAYTHVDQQDWITRHIGGTYSGQIAVWMFFVISGFLVCGSWLRIQDPKRFAIARIRRIWPALLVCLLFTVFVLGPCLTQLGWREYFQNPQTWQYLVKNATYRIEFDLPGMFLHATQKNVVNGSLWSLPYEVMCYAILLVIGWLGLLSKRTSIATLAVLIGYAIAWRICILLWPAQAVEFLQLFSCFGLGVLAYLYADKLPLSIVPLLIFAASLWQLPIETPSRIWVWIGLAAYSVFYLGYRLPAWHFPERLGDYSYGVYLYGYPVQQAIAERFPHFNEIDLFVTSLSATLALAVLSWHFVEKPLLRTSRPSSGRGDGAGKM